MKKSKLLISLLSSVVLVSCNNGSSIVIDQEAFNDDVNYVLNTSFRSLSSALNYNAYYYESNGGYVFTLQMEYKASTLTNIRAIMIPKSYVINIQDKVLPSIGYDKTLILGPSKDVTTYTYPGYNLSFKTTSKDETFDLYLSYNVEGKTDKEVFVSEFNDFTKITK